MGLVALVDDDLHADPVFLRKLRNVDAGFRYLASDRCRDRIPVSPSTDIGEAGSPLFTEQQVSLVASDGAAGLFELSAAESRPDCIVHDPQSLTHK